MTEKYAFGLCLTHDVDRVVKTYQYIYQLIKRLDFSQLWDLASEMNPYWQFERIMKIEERLGVRSSFNVLDEIHLSDRPKSEWMTMTGWQLYAGRYNVSNPQIKAVLNVLDTNGWEIALQGSFTSSRNPERFEYEKNRIETAADTEIIGNRQHHWNLSRPETWRHLRDCGIKYDTSLGNSTSIEFKEGYELIRPFNDEFIVFPWSLMDGAVMNSAKDFDDAWSNIKSLLNKIQNKRSVLVADWHQRVFYEDEFPGWSRMYCRLIKKAKEMDAWIGTPQQFYQATSHPAGTIEQTLDTLSNNTNF